MDCPKLINGRCKRPSQVVDLDLEASLKQDFPSLKGHIERVTKRLLVLILSTTVPDPVLIHTAVNIIKVDHLE